MLLEYVAIAVMIAVATLIAFIAIGLGELFGPKKKSDAKSMPYESGM
jgi:NADH:ubiquinone oxidoreductase subunit 3 (subunit A)